MNNRVTGLTKDAGFQVGSRKTFSFPLEKIWDFMFTAEGISIWLGVTRDRLVEKGEYRTDSEHWGVIKVLKPYSHIRLSWREPEWANTSTLQMRCIPSGENKTVISFHQEKLATAVQRKKMKIHWNEILQKLAKALPLQLEDKK